MSLVEAKRLRTEAGELHHQGMAILDEYKDRPLPADKKAQVDALFDEVEEKIEAAKRMERAEELGGEFKAPRSADIPAPVDRGGEKKVVINGLELDEMDLHDLKSFAPFARYYNDGTEEYRAYQKAFVRYLRKGKDRMSADDVKTLMVGDAPAGGYWVRDQFMNEMIVKAQEVSAMRRLARVLPPIPVGSVIVPTEDSAFDDLDWTTELRTGREQIIQPFGQRRLTPHPYAKRIRVSNTLMRNPAFDIESHVRDRIAKKAGSTEERGYISGDGVQKPLGLVSAVTHPTDPLPVFQTTVAGQVSPDDIINWVYRLPAAYAGAARILCNRSFIRHVRLMRDGLGQNYVWQPGLQVGSQGMILDTPYEFSDAFPTGLDANDDWINGAVVAVLGDFSYYWIVDALQLSVQRLDELYAETNETGFIFRKESDGMPVLTEAFIALQVQ